MKKLTSINEYVLVAAIIVIIGGVSYVFYNKDDQGVTKLETESPSIEITNNEPAEEVKSPGTPKPAVNQPPTIESFTGPKGLRVGVKGTWTAKVTDPEGEKLRYIVRWGDEKPYLDMAWPLNWPSIGAATEYSGTTYTHTYEKEGTYTIEYHVFDTDLSNTRGAVTKTVQVKVAK